MYTRIAFDEEDYPYNHLWLDSFVCEDTHAFLNIRYERYGGIYYEIPVKRFERYVYGKCKKGKNDFLK